MINIQDVNNAPELRFPEFGGEWGKMKLGDLLSFKNGLNADKEKYGNGVKFINVLDIINNQCITYDNIIGHVEVSEREFEKNKVVYGDILFQRSSETREEVGQANVYLDTERSAVFGGFVIRGQKKQDYHPMFMNFLLKTWMARKEITTRSGGSTRYNVGQDTLRDVSIISTTLPEQQKIASFLSAVDQKIQQLTHKKELLEQYKRGVMQKIFSREIRFKDENGKDYTDWEEKRLGEVADFITKGTTPKKFTNAGINYVKIECLQGENIEKTKCLFIDENVHFGELKRSILQSNDILFAIAGATIGKVGIVTNDIIPANTNQALAIVRLKQNENIRFVLHVLQSIIMKKYIEQSISVGAQPNLNLEQMANFKFIYPALVEQQKIASFLSSIDNKIESVNNQITQTQNFEKGLLQQLFV